MDRAPITAYPVTLTTTTSQPSKFALLLVLMATMKIMGNVKVIAHLILECDASCSTCSQSSKICSTCPETRYLNSTTTTCTSSCSSGFAPSFENVCEPCNERCLTCKPKYLNYCLTCAPGLTIQGGTCVASCESGFTFLGDSCVCKPIQSLACPLNCMSCNGPNSD